MEQLNDTQNNLIRLFKHFNLEDYEGIEYMVSLYQREAEQEILREYLESMVGKTISKEELMKEMDRIVLR